MSNISPIGLISFPHLFKARPPAPGAEPRFSVNLVWDAEAQKDAAYKLLRQNILDAAKEKWGEKATEMFQKGVLRSPLRDASEKDYAGYDEGSMYANFWSKTQPGIVDAKLEDVIDPNFVFPGALGRVSYRAFPYEASGNKGVGLGLVNIQITDVSTPRLDGRKSASDEFERVAGGSAPAMADLDDEIPF